MMTIIVLLILAGISIAMLTGENGILNQASNAKTKTVHATVYEQLKIEAAGYYADYVLNTSESSTLIEFLRSKEILDVNNVVNIEKLLGSRQAFGNGTSETGDVYVLKENTEVVNGKQYELTYYVKGETDGEGEYIGQLEGIGEYAGIDENKLYYGDSSIQPTDQKYFTWILDEDTKTATVRGVSLSYQVISYYNGTLHGAQTKTEDGCVVGIIDDEGNPIEDIVIPYSVKYSGQEYLVTGITKRE